MKKLTLLILFIFLSGCNTAKMPPVYSDISPVQNCSKNTDKIKEWYNSVYLNNNYQSFKKNFVKKYGIENFTVISDINVTAVQVIIPGEKILVRIIEGCEQGICQTSNIKISNAILTIDEKDKNDFLKIVDGDNFKVESLIKLGVSQYEDVYGAIRTVPSLLFISQYNNFKDLIDKDEEISVFCDNPVQYYEKTSKNQE